MFVDIVFLDLLVFVFVFDCEVTYSENMVTVVVVVVGELVAKEILGTESDLLKPFRFNRYEKGELHPTSNSPFPWS